MTHELIVSTGLYRYLKVYNPKRASAEEMMRFHSREYINFMKDNSTGTTNAGFNLGEVQTDKKDSNNDCPFFEGLYEYN